MTDEAVQCVWKQVGIFLRGDTGRGFDVGKPKGFETLLDFVRVQGQGKLACFADEELRLVTAMCLLGPDAAGIPPATTREPLLEIARRFEPSKSKRVERIMEFVIAFGCGWQRQIRADGGPWDQRWADAVRALSRAVEPAVTQARLWLTQHVVHFPRVKDHDVSDAHVLTMRMLHPLHLEQTDTLRISYRHAEALVVPTRRSPMAVPSGRKCVLTAIEKTRLVGPHKTFSIAAGTTIILTVHDSEARITVHHEGQRLQLQDGQTASLVEPAVLAIWSCTCGNRQCAQRHRLGAWNAGIHSLWAYVASAVKGLPQLRTNAFVQGMYFPLLANPGEGDARLRLVNIEYKVCRVCAAEYEGERCPACTTPLDAQTRRRMHPRLVCVGTDLPTYEPEERLHCTNRACQNVYTLSEGWEGWEQIRTAKAWQKHPHRLPETVRDHPINAGRVRQALATRLATLRCPLCAAHAPRRATIVWVRQFARRIDWEAHLPQQERD